MLTELHIYTSLAFCLLLFFTSTMISSIFLREYALHLICQRYTIHEAGTAPAEDFITGMRSRFGRCFLWGPICSKDNSDHIVPTAWLVSLLGDSSAFLKALSLWLGALFRHPWCFKKLHGSVTLHSFPNSTGLQRSQMKAERPLGDQGQAAEHEANAAVNMPQQSLACQLSLSVQELVFTSVYQGSWHRW